MSDTPLPGAFVCPQHAAMVTRDRCDSEMDRGAAKCHSRSAQNRLEIAAERRRIDTIIGPGDGNGKLDSLRKRVDSLEQSRADAMRSINSAAWKILIAAVTGSGGVALLQQLLG